MESQLREYLSLFRSEVESLLSLERSQKTLLSLAHRADQEVVWNRILRYLPDLSERHGLNNDVLRYLLVALCDEGVINAVPVWRNDTVQVEDQVFMDDGEVDLVIRDSGQWFICIEMKVWASEGTDQIIKCT
ncbi:PD-(D/E)XK nuclease family protein [Natronorubrum sp. A-ect3]|uniref:PD-(D/E)XK nuclease family protein n=1 Tax=Natronorubrum sp. A-ect3 TaxID=3242698 RepID=UPI00359D7988